MKKFIKFKNNTIYIVTFRLASMYTQQNHVHYNALEIEYLPKQQDVVFVPCRGLCAVGGKWEKFVSDSD